MDSNAIKQVNKNPCARAILEALDYPEFTPKTWPQIVEEVRGRDGGNWSQTALWSDQTLLYAKNLLEKDGCIVYIGNGQLVATSPVGLIEELESHISVYLDDAVVGTSSSIEYVLSFLEALGSRDSVGQHPLSQLGVHVGRLCQAGVYFSKAFCLSIALFTLKHQHEPHPERSRALLYLVYQFGIQQPSEEQRGALLHALQEKVHEIARDPVLALTRQEEEVYFRILSIMLRQRSIEGDKHLTMRQLIERAEPLFSMSVAEIKLYAFRHHLT